MGEREYSGKQKRGQPVVWGDGGKEKDLKEASLGKLCIN